METLLDLLADAVTANGDRTALGLRLDDGSTTTWSYRELDRRSRIAAWRLRALGLEPGDRLLTWSPSTPELPAAYFGAMRAGLVLVPLDLRMSADAVEGIVRASGARHLMLGTGRDAPDPREAGLDRFPTTTLDAITAEPDDTFPPDWEAQLDGLPAPTPRRHLRAGLHLGHDRHAEGRDAQPTTTSSPRSSRSTASSRRWSTGSSRCCRCRTCSSSRSGCTTRCRSAPTSCTCAAATRGSSSTALRDHRVTSMVVVPQVLDLFWSAIEREVAKRGRETSFDRLRGDRPTSAR